MPDAVQSTVERAKEDCCSRCLQPIPPTGARCPGCGHPISRKQKWVPLSIGAIGVLAIVFAMLLMYRTVSEEDQAKAPIVSEETTDELFPDPPPDGTKSEPAKPEKKPPLNEK